MLSITGITDWFKEKYDVVKEFFGGHAGAITLISGIVAAGCHFGLHAIAAGGLLPVILNVLMAVAAIIFVVNIAFYIGSIDVSQFLNKEEPDTSS